VTPDADRTGITSSDVPRGERANSLEPIFRDAQAEKRDGQLSIRDAQGERARRPTRVTALFATRKAKMGEMANWP
jgi:hypothetical protein